MQELYENLIGEEGNLIPEVIKTVGNLYFLRNDMEDFRDALGHLPKFENLETLIQVVPPIDFTNSIESFIKELWDQYCSLRTEPDSGEKIVAKKFEVAKKIGKLRKVRETYQDIEEDLEFETVFALYERELLKDIKNKVVKSVNAIKLKSKAINVSVQRLEEILSRTAELRLINLAMASYIHSTSNTIIELEKDSLAKSANVNYFKYQIALPELNNLFEILGKTLIQSTNINIKSEAFIRPSSMVLVNQKITPQTQYSLGSVEASLLYYPPYSTLTLEGYRIIENFLKTRVPVLIKDQRFEEFLIDKTDRKFTEKLKQKVQNGSSAIDLAIKNPDIVVEILRREEVATKLKDLLKKEKLDFSAINVYLNFLRDWRKAEALFPAINRIKNVEYLLRNEEKKRKLQEEHENGNVYRFDEKQIVYRSKKTIDINFDMRDSTKYVEELGKKNFDELFNKLFTHPRLIELCEKYRASLRKTRYAGDEQIYSFTGISYPAVNSLLFIKDFLQEFKNVKEATKEILKSKFGEEFDLKFGGALYMHFFNQEEPEKYESGINIIRELSKSLKEINEDNSTHPSVYISEKGIYNCGLIIADNCDPESRETFVKSLENELIVLNSADISELRNEPFQNLLFMVKEKRGDIRIKSSKDLEKERIDPFSCVLCLEHHLLNSFSKYRNRDGEYEFNYKDSENRNKKYAFKEEKFKHVLKEYSARYTSYSIPLIASEKGYPDLIKINERYPLRIYTLDLYMMPIDEKDFYNFILYHHNNILKQIQTVLLNKSREEKIVGTK